jgi:hypothetical protein
MYYLYGLKPGLVRQLAATFDSEQQLLAYVQWATLATNSDGSLKFEQATPLQGFQHWEKSDVPLTGEDAGAVLHNPSPSML